MKKRSILILSIAILTYGCPSNNDVTNPPLIRDDIKKIMLDKGIKPPFTIVFCDFTESDTDCVNTIKRYAVEKMKALFETDSLKFFSIAYSQYNNFPFFTSYPVAKTDYKYDPDLDEADKETLNDEIDSLKPIIARSLEETISSLAKNNPLRESCIIGSIEKAYDEFNRYDSTGSTPVKLIIYSDMLEDCTSTLGHYDLEHEAYTASLSRLRGKTAPISFAKFRNLETKIVVSSNRIRGGSEPQYKEFWSRVFAIYGFNTQPILSSGQ